MDNFSDDGLSPYQQAAVKAEQDVQEELVYYMSRHDVDDRLAEITDIALFQSKLGAEEQFRLIQEKLLAWFDHEVDLRAHEILKG